MEYLSLRAAAHDVLGDVANDDPDRLLCMLDAVRRILRRHLTRADTSPLEDQIDRHPLVLLVRAHISDISDAPMSSPISYAEAREAACELAYPGWKPPRAGHPGRALSELPPGFAEGFTLHQGGRS